MGAGDKQSVVGCWFVKFVYENSINHTAQPHLHWRSLGVALIDRGGLHISLPTLNDH